MSDGKKHFDGETYDAKQDFKRLNAQLERVAKAMSDNVFHTLAELAKLTGDPEASISARIRDLRKPKFGGHVVARERIQEGRGQYQYRLVEKV